MLLAGEGVAELGDLGVLGVQSRHGERFELGEFGNLPLAVTEAFLEPDVVVLQLDDLRCSGIRQVPVFAHLRQPAFELVLVAAMPVAECRCAVACCSCALEP